MKVLVISNNCFAKNNSNGRILGCLFKNIPSQDVSQLYIVPGTNDFEVCSNFFLLSDRMVMKGLKSRKNIGKVLVKSENNVVVPKMSELRRKYGRSSFTMLAREVLWQTNVWWTQKLRDWLKETYADVIVFQCGDTPFMYDMVRKIARFLNIPVVLFNTEYYYFIKDSWFPGKDNKLCFRIFKHRLSSKIAHTIFQSSTSIYNSNWLRAHYDKEFNCPSEVIFQSSDFRCIPEKTAHNTPRIVYVGNLGFGRWEPLIDIAQAIQKINPGWSIDVYGVVKTDEAKKLLENTKGLNYQGTIPYDKVLEVLKQSDLLLLVENQALHYAKSTEYGFSTKITDYLYSHIPIFAYGPIGNVGISYLKENQAAFVVSDKKQLLQTLQTAITDISQRKSIVESALNIAIRNHDADRNAMIFRNILEKITTNQNMR